VFDGAKNHEDWASGYMINTVVNTDIGPEKARAL
jgi:hypothetical protein